MTARDQQAGSMRHEVVRAGEADIEVLARVIAEAFFSLTVCRWLIPDGPARRGCLPRLFPALRRARDRGGNRRDNPGPGCRRAMDSGRRPGRPAG